MDGVLAALVLLGRGNEPEFGVTLAGDVSNPTIVNTSGRTILGHVILFLVKTGLGD